MLKSARVFVGHRRPEVGASPLHLQGSSPSDKSVMELVNIAAWIHLPRRCTADAKSGGMDMETQNVNVAERAAFYLGKGFH